MYVKTANPISHKLTFGANTNLTAMRCSVTSHFCVNFRDEWSGIGCLTSQLTIFQSYMWRHIDVQADWRIFEMTFLPVCLIFNVKLFLLYWLNSYSIHLLRIADKRIRAKKNNFIALFMYLVYIRSALTKQCERKFVTCSVHHTPALFEDRLKICYDKAGNLPNKGRNFNTQTWGKIV